MKKFKLITLLAICALSATIAAGCDNPFGSNDDSASVSASVSQSESLSESESASNGNAESSSSVDDESSSTGGTTGDETCVHQWGDWELVASPTCTEEGKKVRYCTLDHNHADYASIAARGHNFDYVYKTENDEKATKTFTDVTVFTYYITEKACCTHCGIDAPYTKTAATDASYTAVTECELTNNNAGLAAGSTYNRYELPEEGYYTITGTASRKTTIWIYAKVSGAGQYALHTLSGGSNATITRHAGTTQFVTPTGADAAAPLDNGEKMLVFNCGTSEYSSEYGATFCFQITGKNEVTFLMEKIAEPAWKPKSVTEKVYATQLGTEKAADGPDGAVLLEASLDTNYVKGDDGYYHIDSADGKILYVAINKGASRWFTDGSALTGIGPDSYRITLYLSDGYTVEGDYKVYNYVPFLLNASPELYGGNPGACYQDFTNKDGVYPLNDELLLFLQRFAKDNKKEENDWLALCYYYSTPAFGTKEYPKPLDEGDNEISLPELASYYCTLPQGYYTVSCATPNVTMKLDGKNHNAPFSITFDNTDARSFVLEFFEYDGNATTATITVESATGFTRMEDCALKYDEVGGYYDYVSAEPDENGKVTVSTKEIYTLNGFEYFGYYVYSMKENTADIELLTAYAQTDGVSIDIYGESFRFDENGTLNKNITVTLVEGDVSYIEIYVVAKKESSFELKITERHTESATTEEA